MIKHIVFFKFKVTTDEADMGELERKLSRLPDLIGEIREYQLGRDIVHSDRSYDFALVSAFESLEALDRYKTHPEHVKVQKLIGEICDHTRSVDFMLKAGV